MNRLQMRGIEVSADGSFAEFADTFGDAVRFIDLNRFLFGKTFRVVTHGCGMARIAAVSCSLVISSSL